MMPPAPPDLARRDAVLEAMQDGLPLVPWPYAEVAVRAGLSEPEVRDLLAAMLADGTIKRLGVVVRHHELGFTANAMVVFDVPDAEVDAVGAALAGDGRVTLCYRRPRRLPHWPYNLFCMVHGRDRDGVREVVKELRHAVPGLAECPFSLLFSSHRYKQCGARPLGNRGGGR